MPIYLSETTASTTESLTPREIVRELDKYVVGQHQAKRAVAIALRNRTRRQKLPPELAEEIAPEEHPDDRTDRRRQDRDRPAPGAARAVAVHQGRGLEVHRGRLRRARRRIDGPRPRRAGRRHGARRAARGGAREGAAGGRRARARSAAAAAAAAAGVRRAGGVDPRAGAAHAREAARAAARRPPRSQAGRDRRAREDLPVVRDHRRLVGRGSGHQRQGHAAGPVPGPHARSAACAFPKRSTRSRRKRSRS